jgi:hypothetical protein
LKSFAAKIGNFEKVEKLLAQSSFDLLSMKLSRNNSTKTPSLISQFVKFDSHFAFAIAAYESQGRIPRASLR